MIHFLLTPDSSSALKIKRIVADRGGRTDVIVGSWPELLGHAINSHILPIVSSDWDTRLSEAIKTRKNGFWCKSLENVPAEAQSIIDISADI